MRRNINTCDGLVNGARGIVRNIVWGDGNSNIPQALNVEFFDKTVGQQSRVFESTCVSIKPISAIFMAKEGLYRSEHNFQFVSVGPVIFTNFKV